jgi:hypothetical protein
MTMGLFVLSLLASASSCATDAQGYCTDKMVREEITYAGEGQSVKINCALGDVVSIAFPPGVELRGEPALGNQAIFEYRAQTDPFRILVWPKYPANARDLAPDALLGERSNLQVFLDSGVTLVIDLKISTPKKSVQQLRFEFPERQKETEFVRERMDAFARKLEDEYQEKAKTLDTGAEDRARRRVARAILGRAQCASLAERRMVDLLVVRAHKICRLGDLIFVEFSIQNRARDLFHLGGVHVSAAGAEEGEAEVEALTEYSGETTLAFDQEVRGVGAFGVSENSARSYAVTVEESGGKKRAVTVNGVEF